MKNDKLNILLFSSKGAGEHYYGPGISAYRLYQGLDINQANLYLAHGYKEQADLDIFTEQYFISDLTGGGLLGGLKFYMKMKKWVVSNAGKFDVVHCIGAFHASFLLAMAFRRQNVPVFIKITESKHTGFTRSSPVSKLLGMQRYRVKNANSISGYISISSEITRNLTEAGIEKNKIYYIPNGVDTDKFSPVTEKAKVKLRKKLLLPYRFTFLFTGAFSDRKNPLLIAKAFEPFFNQKNVQLVLIGPDRDNGDQRLKIEQLIARNNVNNVIVRGHQKNVEIYYQSADVFILPSAEEGLSNSMLEAMACGLPIITTKISGAEDVINESKNGTFISRNKNSITSALSLYLNKEDIRKKHSKEVRNTVESGYSSELILQKHLQLFKSSVTE